MSEEELIKTLEGYRHEIGSLKYRVDNVEKIVDAVHSLAIEMSAQTSEIKHMNDTMAELKNDVADLKQKPVNRWEQIVGTFIGAIAGAAAALLLK